MVSTTKATTRGRAKQTVPVDASDLSVTPRRAKKWEVSARDWVRYQKNPTDESRQRLLNTYLPLVRNVAARMAMGFPRSVELSDLINTGVIGLIEAFGHFDPARGVKFETYAVPRIRGAILDELRALDWVPRSTRAKSREIDRAMTSLENELGRPPEKSELAAHLNITVEELHVALDDVSSTNMLSLDEIIYPDDDNRQVPRIETITDQNGNSVLGEIEKGELRSFLVVAMDRLTEQEKLVIALYYYEELTLKEIGEVMSISESRVSQIHTRAVKKLRSMVREKFALTG
ncbi:MAG: FliA/WhiG family RNA polymerase sigma factor [candidate division Zixibacteria bacterium]|jgi:RNA polymerase sigma factor for flagellar operon FliA|nr:FliA/WhiG family RNA polymerase sigma factor [candidate division Zixibacteria bacterium]